MGNRLTEFSSAGGGAELTKDEHGVVKSPKLYTMPGHRFSLYLGKWTTELY